MREACEIRDGVDAIKRVMGEFEERNNEAKEETLRFGTEEAGGIHKFGVGKIGRAEDVKNRKRRAGPLWAKIKRCLKHSRLTRHNQAWVVESCVESALLFDSAVRAWGVKEIKCLQS